MNAPGARSPRPAPRGSAPGFSLAEMLVAMAIGSLIFGAALSALIFLQKSYSATEQYAVNLADQTRLMDYLTLDLRRATDASFTTDSSGATDSLTLSVPSYYAATDPPSPNVPRVSKGTAIYGPANAPLPVIPVRIVYRQRATFTDPKMGQLLNAVTRREDTYPEIAVAAGMATFPEVVFDGADGSFPVAFQDARRARMKVVFRPQFQTANIPSSNTIVLHGMTSLRNNETQKR